MSDQNSEMKTPTLVNVKKIHICLVSALTNQTKPTDFAGPACPPSLRTEPALAKPVLAPGGEQARLPTQGTWAMPCLPPTITQLPSWLKLFCDSVSFETVLFNLSVTLKTTSYPLQWFQGGGGGSRWEENVALIRSDAGLMWEKISQI